jgi:hypothetical protein
VKKGQDDHVTKSHPKRKTPGLSDRTARRSGKLGMAGGIQPTGGKETIRGDVIERRGSHEVKNLSLLKAKKTLRRELIERGGSHEVWYEGI